jgi:hypothetical protein
MRASGCWRLLINTSASACKEISHKAVSISQHHQFLQENKGAKLFYRRRTAGSGGRLSREHIHIMYNISTYVCNPRPERADDVMENLTTAPTAARAGIRRHTRTLVSRSERASLLLKASAKRTVGRFFACRPAPLLPLWRNFRRITLVVLMSEKPSFVLPPCAYTLRRV